MEMKKLIGDKKFKPAVIIGIIIIVLILGGAYFWLKARERAVRQEPNGKAAQEEGKLSAQLKTEDISREDLPEGMPDLDKPITASVKLSKEAEAIVRMNIKEVSARLKQNPSKVEDWLVLGIYRKSLGDYKGAAECWEYASKLDPDNPIPYNNLADLYSYFDKDLAKAEENWLKALEKGPDQAFVYKGAFDFFHYLKKDDAKAREIIEKGIRENPGIENYLMKILETLNK